MSPGSLLLGAALLLLVTAYVLRPLFEDAPRRELEPDHELSSLMAERDRLLNLISDLDMDRSMGKITQSEYEEQRAKLVQRGAATLRRIDELRPGSGSVDDLGPDPVFDARLEAEIAARRRGPRDERVSDECPSCGAEIAGDDRFCRSCGRDLEAEPQA